MTTLPFYLFLSYISKIQTHQKGVRMRIFSRFTGIFSRRKDNAMHQGEIPATNNSRAKGESEDSYRPTAGQPLSSTCNNALISPSTISQTILRSSKMSVPPVVDDHQCFETVKNDVIIGFRKNFVSTKTISALTEILSRHPQNLELLILRAVSCRIAGNSDQCVVDCGEILRIDPENRFALLHRVSAAYALSSFFNMNVGLLAKIYREARTIALTLGDDRMSLFVLSIDGAMRPESEWLTDKLLDLLSEKPDDSQLALVLLALLLSRRFWKVSLKEEDRLILAAQCVLKNLPTNRIAHEVLNLFEGKPLPACMGRERADYNHIFTDYRLADQDHQLEHFLKNLQFTKAV
jgi:hypothetical protein